MQDARIAACLTDTVMSQLQNYVTEYRTNKARKYFQFQQSLFERKKKEYEKAQEEYAKFADANKNIILLSYRVEQERLENDMNCAFSGSRLCWLDTLRKKDLPGFEKMTL